MRSVLAICGTIYGVFFRTRNCASRWILNERWRNAEIFYSGREFQHSDRLRTARGAVRMAGLETRLRQDREDEGVTRLS